MDGFKNSVLGPDLFSVGAAAIGDVGIAIGKGLNSQKIQDTSKNIAEKGEHEGDQLSHYVEGSAGAVAVALGVAALV